MGKLSPIDEIRFKKFVKANKLLKEDGDTFIEPITDIKISPSSISVKLESGKTIINRV